jgi:hypothetical protein
MLFKRHFIGWVIITITLIIISVLFNESIVVEQVIKEQQMVVNLMQEFTETRIRERTNVAYSFCCNWLSDLTRTLMVSPSDDSQGLQRFTKQAHQDFWTSIYLLIYRVLVIVEWLLVFWVVFIATFMQGLVRRNISVTNTAWSSPIRYHLGLHYALVALGVQVNLLFYPWALSPYVSIAMLTVLSFVLFIIASNIQHKV